MPFFLTNCWQGVQFYLYAGFFFFSYQKLKFAYIESIRILSSSGPKEQLKIRKRTSLLKIKYFLLKCKNCVFIHYGNEIRQYVYFNFIINKVFVILKNIWQSITTAVRPPDPWIWYSQFYVSAVRKSARNSPESIEDYITWEVVKKLLPLKTCVLA